CMVWSEHIFVMLLTHEKFKTFTKKPIANTKTEIAGLYSLALESVEQMNTTVEKGIAAGGTEPNEMRDYGFMQQRSLEDVDGHTWEFVYMDITKFPQQ
ncbi:MAG: glyoxalase/bleomycin resistance/extradiol dioxygenase family protein, partial [Gelidibacter sp.]|nr:glyoxalase/bleomycin resistance/extradiol dioxygenase family protein [Gelidibacter sp.]